MFVFSGLEDKNWSRFVEKVKGIISITGRENRTANLCSNFVQDLSSLRRTTVFIFFSPQNMKPLLTLCLIIAYYFKKNISSSCIQQKRLKPLSCNYLKRLKQLQLRAVTLVANLDGKIKLLFFFFYQWRR